MKNQFRRNTHLLNLSDILVYYYVHGMMIIAYILEAFFWSMNKYVLKPIAKEG